MWIQLPVPVGLYMMRMYWYNMWVRISSQADLDEHDLGREDICILRPEYSNDDDDDVSVCQMSTLMECRG